MQRWNSLRVLVLVAMGCLAITSLIAEEKEEKLKLSDCPAAVQKTLSREANGAKIDEVEKEVEDGVTTFEADVTIDGKPYEIEVAQDGTLIEKSLEEEEDDNAKDEDEVTLQLSECPAAVQTTFKREVNGARIDVVEKEIEGGKTLYEVEIKIEGKVYEIEVAEDGTLISKVLVEDEDDEEK